MCVEYKVYTGANATGNVVSTGYALTNAEVDFTVKVGLFSSSGPIHNERHTDCLLDPFTVIRSKRWDCQPLQLIPTNSQTAPNLIKNPLSERPRQLQARTQRMCLLSVSSGWRIRTLCRNELMRP